MAKRIGGGKHPPPNGQPRGGGRINGHGQTNGHHRTNGHGFPGASAGIPLEKPKPGLPPKCAECGAHVRGKYPKCCPGNGPSGDSRLCVYGAWAKYQGRPSRAVLDQMGLLVLPPAPPPPAAKPPANGRTLPVSISFLPQFLNLIDDALEQQETRSAFVQAACRRELERRGKGGDAHGA